jgi:hypothetical protein
VGGEMLLKLRYKTPLFAVVDVEYEPPAVDVTFIITESLL